MPDAPPELPLDPFVGAVDGKLTLEPPPLLPVAPLDPAAPNAPPAPPAPPVPALLDAPLALDPDPAD